MRCYTHNKTRILMQIEKHMRVHQAFSSRYVCYLALSERMNKKNSNRRTYSSLKTELTSAAPKHVWLNCSINHTEHVLYHVDALLSRDCCLAVCCCRVLNAQVSSSTVAGCSQQFIFCKINFSHGRIYWRISASHVKLMAAWLVTLSDNSGRGGGGSFNLFILNTFCCCYCVIFNPLSSALLFRYQKKSFKIHKHVIISGKSEWNTKQWELWDRSRRGSNLTGCVILKSKYWSVRHIFSYNYLHVTTHVMRGVTPPAPTSLYVSHPFIESFQYSEGASDGL